MTRKQRSESDGKATQDRVKIIAAFDLFLYLIFWLALRRVTRVIRDKNGQGSRFDLFAKVKAKGQ